MQTVKELIEEIYPEETQQIKKYFPDMYKFSQEVQVIPWKEKFQEKDVNPEFFQEIDFLDLLLKNKMISEQEYREKIEKILKKTGYARIIKGVALIEEKKFHSEIAFRQFQ